MSRRRVLCGGVAATGLALAGCVSQSGDDDDDGNGTADGPYSVEMEPVGEVTFDEVPENWVAGNGSWGDMGVALGAGTPEGVWLPERYPMQYYDELPGVDVDTDLTQLSAEGAVDKELFYELDSDVHVIDPNFIINRFGWEESEVEEIESDVGPFFGNTIFTQTYAWHDDYEYYTLYEAFEKLATVFQRQDRYEAFTDLHEEVIGDVQDRVPAESERPSVAILWPVSEEPDSFYPYMLNEGTSYKHWHDLGVTDALAENSDAGDFHDQRGEIDYETLLDVDPDVILLQGNENMSHSEFQDQFLEYMQDNSVASDLQAVEDEQVFQGGSLYQGPIINLFHTERGAQQLYPDEFDEDELFDRQRVADIVNDEF
ncbi:ABC transporter substrate-binding protein [Natronorubrum sp. DTA7]|uniref:ABC transporter substrate-binding protein n=1 Tax=Natronorubrum sp. DTA7 TaxID=3447016 RepID=UPI003F869AAF